MAYTTNTTTFNPTLNELMEEAFERCGLELRTGYDFRTARRSLNFLTAEWANRGINLWTIDQGSITLVPGQATYPLPNDTVDLVDHVIRTNANQGSNQTDININRISVSTYATIPNKLAQGRPIQVWIQRLTGNISPAYGQIGAISTTTNIRLEEEYFGGSRMLVNSTAGLPYSGFVQLSVPAIDDPYTIYTTIFNYTGTQPFDTPNYAYLLNVGFPPNSLISFPAYSPVKLVQQPSITVWPTPDASNTYEFVYYRLRRMQDAGTGTNIEDIPFRFQNALVAGLAYMIAAKKIDVPMDRIAMLKAQYDEAWDLATSEDREKAPDRFVPRVTFYR